MASKKCDVAIIGGGIIGMATAMRLSAKYPRQEVVVLEKEDTLAAHQSGHNSGVIHSGVYYAPGSLKAKNCVAGVQQLLRFCNENGISYELCGKVIDAADEEELPRLDELYRRGTANGVPGLEMIDGARLREIEPHAAGIRGLWSPETGIIDYAEVTRAYARQFEKNSGEIINGARVTGISRAGKTIRLQTSRGDFEAEQMINCAGLYSDAIAEMTGAKPGLRIIPFRGEYYMLTPEGAALVNGLIYPVPDPRFPFLGVHFTRRIGGGVEAGPNAVLAFAREGYRKATLNAGESFATLSYRGFWPMASRYWRTGMQEVYRSLSKRAFTKALQRLVPEIREEHLTGFGSGVRAQAVDANGRLVDDFRIVETQGAIHVLNAPSPGATASLAIADSIVEMAERSFVLAS
jgi:L-2-hydroxyglutarate oxidase LhgO